MNLYKLFSCNVQVQYKSGFLSKAMLFTLITTMLNIILPFIVAYRSRGFWLRSSSFYEQPKMELTFDYLLVAETSEPDHPIVCADPAIVKRELNEENNCPSIEMRQYDTNEDGLVDAVQYEFRLIARHPITSFIAILPLNYQLQTVCPLQMQSLAVITENFAVPPSSYEYYGDLKLYQRSHLPCVWNILDNKYNNSLFDILYEGDVNSTVDAVLEQYYSRDVTTLTKPMFSRNQNDYKGTMVIKIKLQSPETEIRYTPSVMQELKWAWPQYLSLSLVFYWIFERLRRFVFNNRLLMAWEVVPWKNY